jgi:hypothetical protein
MVERTYHKVLSAVVNELLRPFLAVLTLYVRLNKQNRATGMRCHRTMNWPVLVASTGLWAS